MLVKYWMSTPVITISVEDSMQHAISLLREHSIRTLPVVSDGNLVGILSDTDLKRASASDATTLDMHELLYLISKIKIKDIMSKDLITVPEDFTVEETAEMLMTRKISGAPVTNKAGKLVGVITRDDIFKALIDLSGFGKRGVLLAFQVDDRAGSIKELTDQVREFNGRIASILSSYERVPAGSRIVYLRIYEIERKKLPELIERFKRKSNLLYMVDHRENKREIYKDMPA
jgi:acetoin utilization protein AcuB